MNNAELVKLIEIRSYINQSIEDMKIDKKYTKMLVALQIHYNQLILNELESVYKKLLTAPLTNDGK